jgi:hypothetical protein
VSQQFLDRPNVVIVLEQMRGEGMAQGVWFCVEAATDASELDLMIAMSRGPSLALAFTEADVRRLQVALPWQQRQPGYAVRWLDIAEAGRVERGSRTRCSGQR